MDKARVPEDNIDRMMVDGIHEIAKYFAFPDLREKLE